MLRHYYLLVLFNSVWNLIWIPGTKSSWWWEPSVEYICAFYTTQLSFYFIVIVSLVYGQYWLNNLYIHYLMDTLLLSLLSLNHLSTNPSTFWGQIIINYRSMNLLLTNYTMNSRTQQKLFLTFDKYFMICLYFIHSGYLFGWI